MIPNLQARVVTQSRMASGSPNHREIPKINDAAVVQGEEPLKEIDDIIDDEVAMSSCLQFIKKKLFNLRRQSLF